MNCPKCGALMVLKQTKKFRYKDGKKRKFYSCSLWPICESTISAHPDGSPVGIPGDKETKELRKKCHCLLEKEFESNKDRYKFIRKVMKMGPDEAHIGKFDKNQCLQLIGYIEG